MQDWYNSPLMHHQSVHVYLNCGFRADIRRINDQYDGSSTSARTVKVLSGIEKRTDWNKKQLHPQIRAGTSYQKSVLYALLLASLMKKIAGL